MLKIIAAIGLAASFALVTPAVAATAQQKKETCTFGADDQKLTGAKRKAFLAKCMSNADSPRGKPTGAAKPQ
jgi:psiF repeat